MNNTIEEMKKVYKKTVEDDNRFDEEQTKSLVEVIDKAKSYDDLLQISIVYGII